MITWLENLTKVLKIYTTQEQNSTQILYSYLAHYVYLLRTNQKIKKFNLQLIFKIILLFYQKILISNSFKKTIDRLRKIPDVFN